MSRRRSLLPAFLLLALAGCYKEKDYQLSPGLVQQYLQLTPESGNASLPADGISRLRLVATISPNADAANRTIVFTASRGTLVGGTDAGNGTREVVVDGQGRAQIELQSSLVVEDSLVAARVKEVPSLSQSLVVNFTAADPGSVIRFTQAPASAPADGATLSTFTVALSQALANRTVSFATTAGFFGSEGGSQSTTITVDGSGLASVQLRSPSQAGSALVTATATTAAGGTVSAQRSLELVRALAQRMTLAASKYQVQASSTDKVVLTATLLRDIGIATQGAVVRYEIRGSDQSSFGQFQSVTVSNASGQATAEFVPFNTLYRGVATITATVDGTRVSASLDIEVVAPPG
ncbi:MAG: hypothetical protein U0002_15090 [Thermoanaerobaculia bacterium]